MKIQNNPKIQKANSITGSEDIFELHPYLNPLLIAILIRNELFLMRDWPNYYLECTLNDYVGWVEKIESFYADFGLNKSEIINLILAIETQWNIEDAVKRRMLYYNLIFMYEYLKKRKQLPNNQEDDGYLKKAVIDMFAKYDFNKDTFISKFSEFVSIINSINPKLIRTIKAIK